MNGEARWAPDPYRRHELRYWDGARWTDNVSEGDGTILRDDVPPAVPTPSSLPAPRGRRQARTHGDDVERLAEFVGGGHAAARPHRVAAPAASGTPGRTGGTTMFSGPGLGRVAPTVSGGPAGEPVAPGPFSAAHVAAVGPAAPAARGRGRGDLFDALPGSGPSAGRVGPAIEERVGWDWRESRVPEIVSGLAVAALIAIGAVLGAGHLSGSGADAVETVVSTTSPRPMATTSRAVKPKTPKKTVPGAQISTAQPGRVAPRTSSSRVRTTSGSSRTPSRTTSPTGAPTPTTGTTSTSPSPSSSGSSATQKTTKSPSP